MNSRCKRSSSRAILACVTVALALCAMAPASAVAEEKPMSWFVSGTKLASATTVALASTAAVDSPLVLTVPSLGLKVTCSNSVGKVSKGVLEGGEAMSQAEYDPFESCTENSPSTCKVSQPPPTVGPALLLLVLTALTRLGRHVFGWVYHSRTGSPLATLSFEGSCSFAGEQSITGIVTEWATTMVSEEAVQAVEGLGTTENNSLELDGDKAYIEGGKVLFKLASAQTWSFREE
jgi:hypothetical protein